MGTIFYTIFLFLLAQVILSECRSYNYNDQQTLEHNQIDEEEPSEDREDKPSENFQDTIEEGSEHAHAAYSYEYKINSPQTGDFKSQREERVGNNVRGSYSLIEPDGSKRIVEYTADPHNGFRAIVKHEPPSPDQLVTPEPRFHNFGNTQSSTSDRGIPVTHIQHTPLQSTPSPPHHSTTPRIDLFSKPKRLLYSLPSSFHWLDKYKSTPTISTSLGPRYYFNPFAWFNGWPFIRYD